MVIELNELENELTRLRKIETAAKNFHKRHDDIGREWCRVCDKEGVMCIDQLEEALEGK